MSIKQIFLIILGGLTFAVLVSAAPKPSTLRDPTIPLAGIKYVKATSKRQELILHAIVRSESETYAVVNGGRYSVGDAIRDAKLVEINQFSVVLQGSKGMTRLSLWPKVKNVE